MKKLIVTLTILALFLTSCATVVKTKETLSENKVEVEEKEEVKESEETPEAEPEVKEEAPVEVNGDVTTPETPDDTEKTEETPDDSDTLPTPDENELDAKEIDFTDITEEELEGLLESLTGGQTIEFPILPIE